MTTVQRPYINVKFNQEVDDGCLEYKSIPMAVVGDLIKISHSQNEYEGIKQVYNLIPPRPKDINTMATSIARINNLTYSSVAGISKQFIGEEIADVKSFVAKAPPEPVDFEFSQSYVPEQPVRSSTGVRLKPEPDTIYPTVKREPSMLESVSLILGEIAPTSGVVPYRTDMSSQTEWINSKERGFMKRDIMFGYTEASAEYQDGSMATQTQISKPPSGKNISTGMTRGAVRFFENPQDRFGTIQGTPTRQLSREDKIARGASMLGEHHTPKRPDFQGDSATSGLISPKNPMGQFN